MVRLDVDRLHRIRKPFGLSPAGLGTRLLPRESQRLCHSSFGLAFGAATPMAHVSYPRRRESIGGLVHCLAKPPATRLDVRPRTGNRDLLAIFERPPRNAGFLV